MPFCLEMKVRDYECDMQGIVNNAIYQHYLEHARHEFLISRGLSFADLTAAGVIIVVAKAELEYRKSLRAGDLFEVSVEVQRPSKVRIVFEQKIRLRESAEVALKARITATAVNERNRPYFPEELSALL
ncbi:MAG: acyl-CoA thioesterase [Proteobacteria bacterium]|nr:acyl-CoA thioesterase [Pseudomonadota bacterium]